MSAGLHDTERERGNYWRRRALEAEADQETAELRYIGDGMQSAASRLAAHVLNLHRSGRPDTAAPYEVYMAALEAEDYVAQWTDTRTGYAVTKGKGLNDG